MTKDEFWEAINTGGKVYTYNDEIDFLWFLLIEHMKFI